MAQAGVAISQAGDSNLVACLDFISSQQVLGNHLVPMSGYIAHDAQQAKVSVLTVNQTCACEVLFSGSPRS